jgi:hypothetical protein
MDKDIKELLENAGATPSEAGTVAPTQDNNSPDSAAAPQEPEPLAPTKLGLHTVPWFRQKRYVLIVAAVLLAVSGAATWIVLGKTDDQKQTNTQTVQQRLLGAAATVVDGSVQISKDGTNWQDLKTETQIPQGSSIRTAQDGRVVITLDDSSAVRLNNSSTAKLTSLSAKDIKITNENGEIYTRVVKSDRTFSVTVGDESYVALGTAYKTVNRDTTKGVEVYQSEVAVKKAVQKIAEGKRYYQTNPVPELNKKVSDIPADQLQKDDFLKWNLEHDKETDEFKDKLGYFVVLEKTPATAPQPAPATAPKPSSPANGITLSGSKSEKGVSLSWKVTGITVSKGFKIVKSEGANPIYGKSDAAFAEASARSYTWKITDGKTYHFRVCVYNSDGSCTNYSNDIAVSVPYVAPPTPPSGSLSLVHVSSNNVAWTLSGSAPYGLKLVWAETAGPVYPGSSAKYYNGTSTTSATFDGTSGKTYYIRVCMYYEGSCKNYSNEIVVTLP